MNPPIKTAKIVVALLMNILPNFFNINDSFLLLIYVFKITLNDTFHRLFHKSSECV